MALDSEELSMIATNSVFIGLAFLAVVLRLYIRKTQRKGFEADDFLIIISWVKHIVYTRRHRTLTPHIAYGCGISNNQYCRCTSRRLRSTLLTTGQREDQGVFEGKQSHPKQIKLN